MFSVPQLPWYKYNVCTEPQIALTCPPCLTTLSCLLKIVSNGSREPLVCPTGTGSAILILLSTMDNQVEWLHYHHHPIHQDSMPPPPFRASGLTQTTTHQSGTSLGQSSNFLPTQFRSMMFTRTTWDQLVLMAIPSHMSFIIPISDFTINNVPALGFTVSVPLKQFLTSRHPKPSRNFLWGGYSLWRCLWSCLCLYGSQSKWSSIRV